MKRSPELRPVLWDGLVAAAVLLLAVLCGVFIWDGGNETQHLTAVVSVDGTEALRCDLAEFPTEQQDFSGNGYTLFVARAEAEDGRVGLQVTASDCPTQDCVHTGRIFRGGQSIVCLPARIIIQLEGGEPTQTQPDLVIG